MPLHTPPPPQFLVPWCIHSTNIYLLPVLMGSESAFLGSDPGQPTSCVAVGSDLIPSFSSGSTSFQRSA